MKVEGLDNILRNLDKLDPKSWKKEAMKRMKDSQKPARASMKAAAPRGKSGKLKRNIRTAAWTKRRGGELGIFVRTGPTLKGKGRVWYAHFSELGTDRQKAQHFIANAKANYEAKLREDMEAIVRDVVKKANGK